MDKLEKWIRLRIKIVAFCFLVAFVLVAVRAFQLQVLGQEGWKKRAERQHQKVISLTPKRGTIYDRNGEELALSVEVDSIYVEPHKVTARDRTAKSLSDVLSLRAATIKSKLKSNKKFIWLKRQVSPRESEMVKALDLDGVGLTKEHRRFYPNAEVGAQVLGFTGIDPRGLEGVELKYDSVMLGEGGYLVMERDAFGHGIGSGESVVKGVQSGGNIHLTIDKNIQYIAEKELAAGVASARAKAGSVVVLDPATGEILALASQPDYNPNAYRNYRPRHWRNRAVCDTFEPGSTMKVFVMAAALNENLVRADQIIDCENGNYAVGGRVIHDHHPYKKLTAAEVIKVSSNIGVAKIGKALERERLYNYLTDFGFGKKSGIDLPGEVSGLLRQPSRWFEVDLAAISFGQGMTTTPLQLARAAGALANDGFLMDAPIVERITNDRGEVVEKRTPQAVRQVVSKNVARQVREMMALVVDEGGTGTLGAVPGFRVGGKTGTAQKVDPVTGGYSVDKRTASFLGMVPAENPRLVVLVMIDEPKGQVYGGLVAAPVFSKIAAQALRYLKVAPTEGSDVDPLPPLPTVEAVAAPVPVVAVAAVAGEGHEAPVMPDFTGMSYRQVLQAMSSTGLNIKLKGSGRVVSQSPAPGSLIKYANEVWVRLAPPT